MCVEEKCRLFGLHFEPMCHEPHTIGIRVSQETSLYIHAHHTWHTHASHIHTHDSRYAHVYAYTIVDVRVTLQNFALIE